LHHFASSNLISNMIRSNWIILDIKNKEFKNFMVISSPTIATNLMNFDWL
jgi:hypothetical protein